jgi:hypothetical protein
LPAVQAYVPDFLPGAAKSGAGNGKGSKPSQPSPGAGLAGGGSELAAQFTSESGRAGAGGLGGSDAEPTVGLIRTATSPASRAGGVRPGGRAPLPAPATGALEAVPAVVTNVVPVAPLLVAAPSSAPTSGLDEPITPPTDSVKPRKDAKPSEDSKPSKDSKRDKDAKPGKDSKKKDSKPSKDSDSKKDSKAGKGSKPRLDAKPDRKSAPEEKSKRTRESERRKQPVSRGKIVTA